MVSHPYIAGRLMTPIQIRIGVTDCLLDTTLGSALTSWEPNPNSLLTCVDYPSVPCDLGKNTERDIHIVTQPLRSL